jgi:hypothetical protein
VNLGELRVKIKQLKCFSFPLKVFYEKAVEALKIIEKYG